MKWWEEFRVALASFPPAAADAPFIDLAARFGVTATESPYVDPDRGLAELLIAGEAVRPAEDRGADERCKRERCERLEQRHAQLRLQP
jgi:hypothetical protein